MNQAHVWREWGAGLGCLKIGGKIEQILWWKVLYFGISKQQERGEKGERHSAKSLDVSCLVLVLPSKRRAMLTHSHEVASFSETRRS